MQLLGFLHVTDLSVTDAVVLAFSLAMYPSAIIGWRDVRVLWLVSVGFLATTAFYIPDSFHWEGYERVCAPAIALGIAAVGHWVAPPSRSPDPSAPVRTEHDETRR